MASFAPLKFLRSPWNPFVWTAIDNDLQSNYLVTSLILYTGLSSTLPMDIGQYAVNCIMMHQADVQLFQNVSTNETPDWQPFGAGTSIPLPLVAGDFLTNDGTSLFWADVYSGATTIQVQNFLDNLLTTKGDTLVHNGTTTVRLPIGTDGYVLTADSTQPDGLAWEAVSSGSGYNTIQLDTVPVTQRSVINFSTLFDVVDDSGNMSTDIDIDVYNLANDATFISDLTSNSTFITDIQNISGGGSGLISNGREYRFGYNPTGSPHGYIALSVFFEPYLITDLGMWGVDATTGALINISSSVNLQQGISISEDGLTLYTLNVLLSASGGHSNNVATVTLKAYDNTLTQIGSDITGTFTESYSGAFRLTDNNTPTGSQQLMTFFVQSGHLVITGLGSNASSGAEWYATDLTISGSSLTTPIQTNLKVATQTGPADVAIFAYAVPFNSDVYMQVGGTSSGVMSTTVDHYTYSAGTFTSVDSSSAPFLEASPGGHCGGFQMVSTSVIGRWRNTSVVIPSTAEYFSAIYNTYTY